MWEIRTKEGRSFYQDRILFEGTFDEAIAFVRERYRISRKEVAIHRPKDPYAWFWINELGETNRNTRKTK